MENTNLVYQYTEQDANTYLSNANYSYSHALADHQQQVKILKEQNEARALVREEKCFSDVEAAARLPTPFYEYSYSRKDLEESSTRVSCLHKQILFIPFLVCFRSNHLLIATPYRPILRPILVVARTSFIHSSNSIHHSVHQYSEHSTHSSLGFDDSSFWSFLNPSWQGSDSALDHFGFVDPGSLFQSSSPNSTESVPASYQASDSYAFQDIHIKGPKQGFSDRMEGPILGEPWEKTRNPLKDTAGARLPTPDLSSFLDFPNSTERTNIVRPVLSPLKLDLVDRVMAEFYRLFDTNFGIRRHDDGAGESGSQDTPIGEQPQKTSDGTSGPGGQKRKNRDGDSSPPDDENDDDPNKRGKVDPSTPALKLPGGRKLACPFFKHNPCGHSTNRACVYPGFPSISRVKEHLYRNHTLPIQCPRCCQTFSNEDDCLQHQRAQRGCEWKEGDPLEGVSKAQEAKLRRKKRSTSSFPDEARWKVIYKILFPQVADDQIPSACKDPSDLTQILIHEN